jgi:hypothetical protein
MTAVSANANRLQRESEIARHEREQRLRQRIDQLTHERDQALTKLAAAQRRATMYHDRWYRLKRRRLIILADHLTRLDQLERELRGWKRRYQLAIRDRLKGAA